MSRTTKTILVGNMKGDWNIKNLKDFLKEELIFQGNKKGYLVDVSKIKVIEKPKVVFVESICKYVGKKKSFELQEKDYTKLCQ